jgi:predicted GIY-YIG superfamily endonuclease
MCAEGTYYAEIAVDVARPLLEHNGKKGKGTSLKVDPKVEKAGNLRKSG